MPAPSPGPELSSIASAVDELAGRVTRIAEESAGTELDWLASNLFDVERSLLDAGRRLEAVKANLRSRD